MWASRIHYQWLQQPTAHPCLLPHHYFFDMSSSKLTESEILSQKWGYNCWMNSTNLESNSNDAEFNFNTVGVLLRTCSNSTDFQLHWSRSLTASASVAAHGIFYLFKFSLYTLLCMWNIFTVSFYCWKKSKSISNPYFSCYINI